MDRSDLPHLLSLVLLLAALPLMRRLPGLTNGNGWRRLRSTSHEKKEKRTNRPPRP